MSWKLLLTLFFEFFKTGLFAVGGGLATIPFLQEMMNRYHWFSTSDLMNMIAVSESTPGPIGVNMATYVGYATAGVPGGIVAVLGLVTPAVVIILLVSRLLSTLWKNPKVQGLFYALRPASVGLIAAAAFSVCGVSLFTWDGSLTLHWGAIALAVGLLVAMNLPKVKELPSVAFVAIAAVVGIMFQMV